MDSCWRGSPEKAPFANGARFTQLFSYGIRAQTTIPVWVELGLTSARAYIVGVVNHPYLATRLPLWLTLSSYAFTTPAVLAVGRTTTGALIPTSDQLLALGRPRRRASCPKER
ncbi:hypothetical protein BHM03_00047025 [Ensete ventricosum]|nr:hypothetical protein BHM03_00047025 [Ensete ventricosum]